MELLEQLLSYLAAKGYTHEHIEYESDDEIVVTAQRLDLTWEIKALVMGGEVVYVERERRSF